jgi:pilus assembly protein FimV
MFRKISPWIALLMLVVSDSSMALGLGDIKLNSSLNQPFDAEIRLISADSLAKSQIVINLASQDEFNRAGVEHYFFLRSLKFVPVVKADGSVYVKVTSKEAIKEPFLDFLIEVNWPNGRIIREYTVLLDPPAFTEVQMSSTPETAVSNSNNNYQPKKVETNTIAADNWSGDNAIAVQGSSNNDRANSDAKTDSYVVKDADTLWGIARKNRAQNTSIQQTMVAIFNANPAAFSDNNMNQLKRGSALQIDSAQAGLSQQQALLEIARQNQLWGGRGNAGTRPDAVIDTADYASTSTTGASSEPRLKLAAVGEGDTGGSSNGRESEAVTTLSAENQSLRSQVDSKNERIEKLERLLELQSSQMASISDNANANSASEDNASSDINLDLTSGSESPEANAADISSELESDVSAAAVIDPADSTKTTNTNIDNDAAVVENVIDAQEPQSEVAEPSVEQLSNINTAPTMNKKEQSLLDSITNLSNTVWLALGSGVFVIFFSFLYIRRRNMADEEFQESLVVPVTEDLDEDGHGVADDILAAEMGVDHDYIPESEIDDFNDDAVDTETNADPLGEADVYLAYGKFDQAERILRDALEEEPDRLDLRLKIMECFAETKSLSEFKDQKREILEVLATDDTVAEQVNIMERQAWPEEQQQLDDLPSTEDIFGDLSFGNDAAEDELSFPDENDSETNFESIKESDLDDALEMSNTETDDELTTNESDDISTENEYIDADIDLESDGVDFTTDDDDDIAVSTETPSNAVTEDVDFISESDLMDSEMDDDLDDDLEDEPIDESILDLGDVDEASTKLDLARAYIDMEDFDGASEILQEVLTEGSESQKSEAEELLEKMK